MGASSLIAQLLLMRCARCAQPGLRRLCSECRRLPLLFWRTPKGLPVYALGSYNSPIGESVQALKYNEQTLHAAHLGAALAALLPNEWEQTCLVPVPLHPLRLAERGFNQSALLARALAKVKPLSPRFDLLKRCTYSVQQAGQSSLERKQLSATVFQAKPLRATESKARIVLVDDVVTTGSTLQACADAMTQAGYQVIGALCCALAHDSVHAPSEAPNTSLKLHAH